MSERVGVDGVGGWPVARRNLPIDRSRRHGTSGSRSVAASPAQQWAAVVLAVVVPACLAGLVIGLRPALTVIAACSLVGALVGLRVPVLGLYSVATMCTLDAMTRVYLMDGGWLRWNTFNYLLLLASLLGAPFLIRLRNGQLRLLQSLSILLALGLLRTPDMARGMQDLLGMLAVFGLMVYFVRAAGEPDIWYWLGIVTGVTGALVGLAFYRTGVARMGHIDPNAWSLSSLTALSAIALAYQAAVARGRGAVSLAILAALNSGWIFLSGSRGSMLGACCVLAYLLAVTPGLHRRVGMLLVGALLLVGVSAQFGELETHAIARISRLFDSSRDLTNRTSHRWSLAVGGWRMFEAHPVVGVGTGGFIPAWRRMGDAGDIPDFEAVARGREAHSAWIKVLAENGAPGGLLLAAAVLSFALVGRRTPGYGALGALASVSMAAIFLSTEFQSKGVWFLAAGVLVMMHQRALAPPARAESAGALAGPRAREGR